MSSDSRAFAGALGVSVAVLVLLYWFEPVPVSVGVGGVAILTVVAARRPLASLSLVAATLPLYHRPPAIGDAVFAPSELLLFAALGGLVLTAGLRLVSQRDHAWTGHLQDWIPRGTRVALAHLWVVPLIVLTVAALLILLTAVDAPDARAAGLREWRWTFAEPLLFVGLLILHARDERSRIIVAGGYAAGAVAVALWGLVDAVLGNGVAAGGVLRVDGPFPHPNAYALYLLRPAVAGVALLIVWRIRSPLPWIALGVIAAALLASFARSAMLGVFVAGLLLMPWLSRRVRVVAAVAGGVAVVLLFAFAGDRMIGTSGTDSLALRGDIWRSSVAMIRDNPIVGYGPDQFLYVYTPRYIEPVAWAERFTAHGHNFLIDAWVRVGIIGAAFALVVVVVITRGAVRCARQQSIGAPLAMAATIGLAAALAQGMVDDGYFVHDLAMSGWLLAWLAFERHLSRGAPG